MNLFVTVLQAAAVFACLIGLVHLADRERLRRRRRGRV